MASPQSGGRARRRRESAAANIIVKEGFLCKKGGLIKSWSRRYFVLNHQCLCYFKRELNGERDAGLQPLGRVFLSDIVNIETEGVEKKKAFVFALHTKKRGVLLQASNSEDKRKWVEAVRHSLESDSRAEREDPFRKTLRRLKPGLKRVTLVKDPIKGIGCTIKSAAGHIMVNRIIEDGPIARTGILRPGDEILDIHGTGVTGMQVSEVVEVIKQVPDQFLATVQPLTSISKDKLVDTGSVLYSEIRLVSPSVAPMATRQAPPIPEILISRNELSPLPKLDASPAPSLDDVGYYDDEDDGDIPPPLPPRTEDALVILDPPPISGEGYKPPLPPKPSSQSSTEDISLQPLPSPSQRPAIHRSKSEDMLSKKTGATPTSREAEAGTKKSPRLPRRNHLYEEVQPMLNYMDIRKLDFSKAGSDTETLVKVELDWKHKVRV